MQKTKLLLNILALFLCILPAVSMAQGGGNVTVSGIVTSADDKQPLIGVNVISGATSGVSTLADGTYRITVSSSRFPQAEAPLPATSRCKAIRRRSTTWW